MVSLQYCFRCLGGVVRAIVGGFAGTVALSSQNPSQ
jgi:hypothetical protein